jgi:hypothetical protein
MSQRGGGAIGRPPPARGAAPRAAATCAARRAAPTLNRWGRPSPARGRHARAVAPALHAAACGAPMAAAAPGGEHVWRRRRLPRQRCDAAEAAPVRGSKWVAEPCVYTATRLRGGRRPQKKDSNLRAPGSALLSSSSLLLLPPPLLRAPLLPPPPPPAAAPSLPLLLPP